MANAPAVRPATRLGLRFSLDFREQSNPHHRAPLRRAPPFRLRAPTTARAGQPLPPVRHRTDTRTHTRHPQKSRARRRRPRHRRAVRGRRVRVPRRREARARARGRRHRRARRHSLRHPEPCRRLSDNAGSRPLGALADDIFQRHCLLCRHAGPASLSLDGGRARAVTARPTRRPVAPGFSCAARRAGRYVGRHWADALAVSRARPGRGCSARPSGGARSRAPTTLRGAHGHPLPPDCHRARARRGFRTSRSSGVGPFSERLRRAGVFAGDRGRRRMRRLRWRVGRDVDAALCVPRGFLWRRRLHRAG